MFMWLLGPMEVIYLGRLYIFMCFIEDRGMNLLEEQLGADRDLDIDFDEEDRYWH